MNLYDKRKIQDEEQVVVKTKPEEKQKTRGEKSFREIVEEYFNWKELEGQHRDQSTKKGRLLKTLSKSPKLK